MAVILATSLGDIVIDLHTNLCPITSKNFLKLCKLKYYNNCLFHDVKKDFVAQTGDPTGTGFGGDSVYKFLYGDQARFFDDEIHPKLIHDKIGTVAMASAGENLNASQFYITLRAGLDYLDGKHTVFGEVAEGFDTLTRINEAYVDDKGRPFKNIRIKHVDILDDPFDEPPQLIDQIPDKSPEIRPPAEGEEVRLEDDWVPMDEQMDSEELDKSLRRNEAHSRAVVLEMIGDIPEAEMAPPENVLFVCKLNPVTEEDDLKTIFARFGKIIAADIIRDYKTGESLCYGFIEFVNKEACEAAYFKMDNVLIDDRRIHVDFSQSVAKLWTRFRRFGTKNSGGPEADHARSQGGGCFRCGEYGHLKKNAPNLGADDIEQDAEETGKPKYTVKDSSGQRGNPCNRYEMVFEDHENSDYNIVEAVPRSPNGPCQRPPEAKHSAKRGRGSSPANEGLDDSTYRSKRSERRGTASSEDENQKGSGPTSSLRDRPDDRRDRWRRNKRPGKSISDDRAGRSLLLSAERYDGRRGDSPPSSSRDRPGDRRGHSTRNDRPKDRISEGRAGRPPLSSRERFDNRSDQSPPSASRDRSDNRRGNSRREDRITDTNSDNKAE